MEAKAQKSGTKKARNRRKNSFSRPKAISKIILIALAALSLVGRGGHELYAGSRCGAAKR